MASVDAWLLRAARTHGHTPQAERIAARFTRVGEHAGVWLAIGTVGIAVDHSRRERWRGATARVLGTYALNTALKQVIHRERPQLADLPALVRTPTRLSFPSAHSATSFAGARAYSRLGLPSAPLYGLAVGLALSRLYLGVHYPSDVLAGAALGTFMAGGS